VRALHRHERAPADKKRSLLLPAGNRIESTVRYRGIKIDGAIEIAEKIDV
jgi:hypothetical protein